MDIRKIWDSYNLSIVLYVMFMLSLFIQSWAGWNLFQSEQAQHHQAAEIFGRDGYIWQWLVATFENWQSEFLQLFTFVILTASLIHRGSHESKDGDEEIKERLNRIEEKLNALQKSR